jgi:hypothetical protein
MMMFQFTCLSNLTNLLQGGWQIWEIARASVAARIPRRGSFRLKRPDMVSKEMVHCIARRNKTGATMSWWVWLDVVV